MTDNQQDPKTAKEEGGYGAPTAEQEMAGRHVRAESGAAVPSAEAEMDPANTDEPAPGRSFSSESGQDAAGLPDGSGTDLPESRSPKDRDDDKDAFDAG
ncbi:MULTISPECIES: hypothetical protein [unclassified Arthrobacter]|uniref:hypothetical protein n=1 Tax=unclassified Arthrobacter TaxID=235627 RepID=UPI001D7A24C8|nr:hypothetical protein [Arthrobacter sp. Bi26]CAH0285101.1 hypothetical protein SRABI26_04056 [Arthrobacter sp. Bi26]